MLFDSATNRFRCIDDKGTLERISDPRELVLRIYLDHSVVEVFIDSREVFSSWFRPHLRKGNELRIWPILDGRRIDYEIDVWRLSADGAVDAGVWDRQGDSTLEERMRDR
jgi:hypothetical protein